MQRIAAVALGVHHGVQLAQRRQQFFFLAGQRFQDRHGQDFFSHSFSAPLHRLRWLLLVSVAALTNRDQPHEVGRSGDAGGAGDQSEHVARGTALPGAPAPASANSAMSAAERLRGTRQRRHAPQQVHAVAHRLELREGINVGGRPVLRQHSRGVGGLGEDRDRANVEVARGMRHGLANGLRDRQMLAPGDAPAAADRKGWASASATMRAIISTASRGNLPIAVSPESMTASVPSKMALATSLASARVGRGFSVMDSSICVAVMTGLRKSSARRMTYFWMSGTFSGGNFDAEIAARHHHAIRRPRGWRPGFRWPAASPAWRRAERSPPQRRNRAPGAHHIFGGAHKRDGHHVDPVLQTEVEVALVFLGERRNADVRTRQVDALMLAQHPAVQHLADHVVAARSCSPPARCGHRRAECARPASHRSRGCCR